MKTTFAAIMMILLSCTALAVTLPDGFVYRAKCEPSAKSTVLTKIDVTLRLYTTEEAATPSWTGVFRDVPIVTNGLFQIWVSEAAHDTSVAGEESLEQALWRGEANWIGIAFGSCRESKPRRMMVTTPLVNTAVAAEAVDAVSLVDDLVDCDTLTADRARLGNVECGTFVFGDVRDIKFNFRGMNARSVQLSRDSDNAILSRVQGGWTSGVLEPGSAVTNTDGRAAFLTLRSVGSMTAPLLTVPVPAGKAFVWQSAPATCVWRFTPIGAE